MRKALTSLPVSVLLVAAIALPSAAGAAPSVAAKIEIEPIPGFPHTGDILGAGADAQVEYTIAGTEYFGSPPPVIGVNGYLPSGARVQTSGFPTCAVKTLEMLGPIACPKDSALGPVGKVIGFVTFGGERVEEEAELFSFFRPGGGGTFLVDGHTPTELEILSTAHIVNPDGRGGAGPELAVEVPLVASVPGAPYASARSISARVGAAYRSHGHTIYAGRLPDTCPKGGWPVKSEVIFAENGEPSKPEPVDVINHLPCPSGKGSS